MHRTVYFVIQATHFGETKFWQGDKYGGIWEPDLLTAKRLSNPRFAYILHGWAPANLEMLSDITVVKVTQEIKERPPSSQIEKLRRKLYRQSKVPH